MRPVARPAKGQIIFRLRLAAPRSSTIRRRSSAHCLGGTSRQNPEISFGSSRCQAAENVQADGRSSTEERHAEFGAAMIPAAPKLRCIFLSSPADELRAYERQAAFGLQRCWLPPPRYGYDRLASIAPLRIISYLIWQHNALIPRRHPFLHGSPSSAPAGDHLRQEHRQNGALLASDGASTVSHLNRSPCNHLCHPR